METDAFALVFFVNSVLFNKIPKKRLFLPKTENILRGGIIAIIFVVK